MSAEHAESVAISPSALRADIYRLLDRVIDTGEPLYIDRGGRRLKVIPMETNPRGRATERLVQRSDAILGDPDELDTVSWADAWHSDPA